MEMERGDPEQSGQTPISGTSQPDVPEHPEHERETCLIISLLANVNAVGFRGSRLSDRFTVKSPQSTTSLWWI